MPGLLSAARRLVGRGKGDLVDRVQGLAEAVEAGRGRLDDADLDAGAQVVRRVTERLQLSADHTVVALAGATGSGKSSTFNRLTGLDLAAVGVRRPTTSWATACIWGGLGSAELMDWLGIPERHRVLRDSMLDIGRKAPDLQGLVLLDLPDHDSTESSHHLEVDRLITRTDLMVWVLDPQKYADAAVHDRYLAPLAAHQGVILVTLNHIDEVPADRREPMLADLRRLLDADGLDAVPVIATSSVTGEGVEELHEAIASRVAAKAATRERFGVDVGNVAGRLAAQTGDAEPPRPDAHDKQEVTDAVADAAGVPTVVSAVHQATARRAGRVTGWPPVAWLSRLRPDPLKRLHLDIGADGRALVASARSSLPPPTKVQRAHVDSVVRRAAENAASGLPARWADAVRSASTAGVGELDDRLDRALGETDLGVGSLPWWCRLVQVLQWLLFLAALAGAIWLLVLAGMDLLRLTEPAVPKVAGLPVPTVLLIAGVVLGIVLAVLARMLVAAAARSRARRADRRLRAAIRDVVAELVCAPMDAEIDAYRRTRDGLRRARG